METTNQELGLDFKLLIGVENEGDYLKDVTLLESNGIAEKVILRKTPEKPSTWMARVISVSTESIGNVSVGGKCRAQYVKENTFDIPHIVQELPFFEANNMIVEIHRRVWDSKFPDSNYICMNCGHKGSSTVDLEKVGYAEKDVEKYGKEDFMEEDSVLTRKVDIKTHLTIPEIKSMAANSDSSLFKEASGAKINSFVFRTPKLIDLINHEKHHADEIVMWRKIAFDCLESVIAVSEDGQQHTITGSMYKSVIKFTLFDQLLGRKDLSAIRETVRENYPYIPFNHDINCDNCGEATPIILSPEDFFGE